MNITKPRFEDRLLPILLEDLRNRQAPLARTTRPRGRRRAAVVLAAAAVVVVTLLLTSGGDPDATLNIIEPSAAMLPTLKAGQQVAVDPGAYRSATPARGDIIAFTIADDPGFVAMKRVIGISGDTVRQVSGVVFVNGHALDEPYARADTYTGGPWTVMPGHVFVMGDNRPDSDDSRYTMGQVAVEDIIGKVLLGVVPDDQPQGPPTPQVRSVPS